MGAANKKILTFIITLILMISTAIPAFATDDLDKTQAVESFIKQTCTITSDDKIRYTNGTVKAYVKEEADGLYTQSVVLEDGTTVVYYNPSSVDILYRQANKFLENEKVGEKVNDITNNMQVEANTEAAAIMLSGFKPILELAIGVIVVLITFGMTLFSSLDICYIAFPVFRNKMEDSKQSGNSITTKKSSNGDVSLRWITDDAQYAVTQGTIDSGKSPWTLYFKKRVASYIFLGIILFILLTGNISIITDLAINVVAGIIDIISGLAS